MNLVAQLSLRTRTRRSPEEQRAHPRKQVRLAAKIALGETTADCTIVDISKGGAQVHAPSVLRLPNEVLLLFVRDGLVVRARRVWSRFPLCGLEFLSAQAIDEGAWPTGGASEAGPGG